MQPSLHQHLPEWRLPIDLGQPAYPPLSRDELARTLVDVPLSALFDSSRLEERLAELDWTLLPQAFAA
ncbi:MAG: hypothetical protein CVV27_10455 [Candidatus Melainabacteria bacterium HGW-Melainabacteria-1]|nr:MAG: hypothetical protein CVV27_10455 [Candidatus Melainabacteria bacterium HGW-Melainabacteria-1]